MICEESLHSNEKVTALNMSLLRRVGKIIEQVPGIPMADSGIPRADEGAELVC